eukprot:51836-Eustigmatos_ZCMA.PRE.1
MLASVTWAARTQCPTLPSPRTRSIGGPPYPAAAGPDLWASHNPNPMENGVSMPSVPLVLI